MASPSDIGPEVRIPLSGLQTRLWNFACRGVRLPEHHVQLCLQTDGPLNIPQFHRSLNALVARHEGLRARVEVAGGLAFQRVSAEGTLALPILDLSQRTSVEPDTEARKRMRVWAREPFDLSTDMLIRCRLVRLATERHWLHVVAHRFICDDESMEILARDLAAVYGALVDDLELPPPPAPLHEFFAEAHTRPQQNDDRAGYSGSRLRAGLPPAETKESSLHPSDSAAERSATRAVERGPLSIFCGQQRIGMPQLTLAAFAILLQRYTGRAEISLSVEPFTLVQSGRTRPIGPISDALPVPLAVEGSATVTEILTLAGDAYAAALSNAAITFDTVGEPPAKGGAPAPDSLTDALFVFTDRPRVEITAGGVRFRSLEEQPCFSRFSIECHVTAENERLKIQAIYRKNVCEAAVIERLLDNYCQVLAAMVAGRGLTVDELLPPIANDRILERQKSSDAEQSKETEHGPAQPPPDIVREVAEVWSELLGVSEVGIHENFFALGGDSILSVLMVAKCRQRGLHITPRQVFQHKTIASLAAVAVRETPSFASSSPSTEAGGVNLTPIQQWFFEQPQRTLGRFNQAVLLEARRGLSAAAVIKAVRSVQSHHDSLRLTFLNKDGQWRQSVGHLDSLSDCVRVDLSQVALEKRGEAVQSVVDELQSAINIENGSLARTAWFDFGPDVSGRLLVIIHHLAVDGVSWRILLEDLEAACAAAERDEAADLPPFVTPYQQWAAALSERARSSAVQSQIDYWLEVLRVPGAIPLDFNNGRNTEGSAEKISITFDPQLTSTLLQRRAEVSEVWIQQTLLASLGQALGEWTGRTAVRIDLEGHGRQDISMGIDVGRTVGWFTSLYPLSLPSNPGDQLRETLTQIRERLRSVPDQGIGYGLLRFLSPDASVRESLATAESAATCFNYLGQFDQLWSGEGIFRPLDETMSLRCGDDLRAYVLQLDASITGGQLRVDWEYSANLHRRETIQGLADSFKHHLLKLAEPGFLNDEDDPALQFALVTLDRRQLDQVLSELDPATGD